MDKSFSLLAQVFQVRPEAHCLLMLEVAGHDEAWRHLQRQLKSGIVPSAGSEEWLPAVPHLFEAITALSLPAGDLVGVESPDRATPRPEAVEKILRQLQHAGQHSPAVRMAVESYSSAAVRSLIGRLNPAPASTPAAPAAVRPTHPAAVGDLFVLARLRGWAWEARAALAGAILAGLFIVSRPRAETLPPANPPSATQAQAAPAPRTPTPGEPDRGYSEGVPELPAGALPELKPR